VFVVVCEGVMVVIMLKVYFVRLYFNVVVGGINVVFNFDDLWELYVFDIVKGFDYLGD